MIGIKSIASYVASDCIDNLWQAKKFSESEDFIRSKIGALCLPTAKISDLASDFAFESVQKLKTEHDLDLDSIQALAVVTQNPDNGGLPHCSAILHGKLGLNSNVACFDIGLGCSGYVYGLSVLRGLMHEAGFSSAILCTSDQYSRIIDRDDRVTSLLFGDAATATWLTSDGPLKFGAPILETLGAKGHALLLDNAKLKMNGRQVFDFAAINVPAQIKAYLHRENIQSDEVDLYCMHQGSAAIIHAIARRFPECREKFVLDLQSTGNTVSSSIPLLLENHFLPSNFNSAIISGFGVGLSWATNMIYRFPKN